MVTKKQKAPLQAAKSTLTPQRFNTWNKWLAGLYALQAIALLVASAAAPHSVQIGFMAANPLAGALEGELVRGVAAQHLFDLNVTWVVAATLVVLAITHAINATRGQKRYEAELARGRSSVRWIGYSLAAALILPIVALLVGLADVTLLVMIAGATLIAGAAGLLADVLKMHGLRKPMWLAYLISCLSALAPGIVIVLSIISAEIHNGSVGAYLYGIIATLIALFVACGIVQYRAFKKGSFVYTERSFILIGVVAVTATVWQLFAGVLRP
jgi:hypothetical protein